MAHVYTAPIDVCHHELDAFGRVQPAVYLRYLSQAAVDASTAAGFDAGWYARAGAFWLVRRSTFELARPARAGERLEVRTWVEDFRRVRSHRRYELRDPRGELLLDGRTDWVFVDALSGRLRRVPEEMAGRFGIGPEAAGRERPGWIAPAPPPAPARVPYRVRFADVDSLAHVNNAAYLEVLTQATLDVLDGAGWTLDRLCEAGSIPELATADVEYLEAARYRERLETVTWLAPGPDLGIHQRIERADDGRPMVRASTRWRFVDPVRGTRVDPPTGLPTALASLLAA